MTHALASFNSYVDRSWPLGTAQELSDPDLADLSTFRPTVVDIGGESIFGYLADRRIVGADWLAPVAGPIAGAPPIVAFASLKGGVGRSTALSVAAQDLSTAGLRVLAIDLDLEAPGLGSLLLPPENRPKYGTLDFFVERGASKFVGADFSDLMEASPFFESGAPVFVSPAFGTLSASSPSNVLGKLSRAYIEDQDAEGGQLTFLDRTRILIEGLLSVRAFDVILVDARAGLHETAAASLLGIGADVLLFGGFQQQTFEGYKPLLAHFAEVTSNSDILLPRLRMVQSKVNLADADEITGFLDESHKLFAGTLYGEQEQSVDELEEENQTWFNLTDPDGPHYPWIIGNSASYRLFDPRSHYTQLDPSNYSDPFGDFLSNLRDNIAARLEISGG